MKRSFWKSTLTRHCLLSPSALPVTVKDQDIHDYSWWTKHPFFLCILLLGLSAMETNRASAQAFTTLHSFTPTTQKADGTFTNSDGAGPDTSLILSGNTLYGTTYFAGTNGWGTAFAVDTDGTGFTALRGFSTGPQVNYPDVLNSDGANPSGGLLLSANTLYGTAYFGGTNGSGTVFAFNTDGTGFRVLHSFSPRPLGTNTDGANPSADLVLSGNTLYGTCYQGGTNNSGTVFAINTDGTAFRVLYSFSAAFPPDYTNSDGGGLFSGLALSGNTLYGAASSGGSLGNGTVFALKADGTGFTNLHSFTASSDGAAPIGRLLLSGNTLYGTAQTGGISSNGTVFSVKINGTGFATLHSFAVRSEDNGPGGTNSEGAYPSSGVILSGNTLYGTTYAGGSSDSGTVFSVNVDGTGFTIVHDFTGGADGANSEAGLVLSGNTLYGTTYWGGAYGRGNVFSVSFPPQLTTIPSATNLILSWPTNYAGFDYAGYTLQSTTNLASPVWTTSLPAPVVINGQNTVTNLISGSQQFFRLAQ